MSLRTSTFCESVTLHKRHLLIAKEDHPFVNGYDKSTLSYEKELPNRRFVEKVKPSVFEYILLRVVPILLRKTELVWLTVLLW